MKLSFITLTNDGYKEFTENCLVSLKKIGIESLKVYCIDQKSFDYLSPKFNNIIKMNLKDEEIESNLVNFRRGNWSKIVLKKFNIIYEELQNNNYVLFTDGDIVYIRNGFIEYCLENIGDADIIMQDDRINDQPVNNIQVQNIHEICSGFMLIKKNQEMLKLFNPKNIPELEIECDQHYFNQIKDKLNYKLLPMDLFPNGSYFRLRKPLNKFMIHFNFIIGTKKKDRIKKYNYWFL